MGSRVVSRLLVASAVVALAVVAVVVGRWEHRREVRNEVARAAAILRAIGPLDQHSLSGYRRESGFDCLVYRRGGNAFALELCVDPAGRVVEAVDRRSFDRTIASLRFDSTSSTLRVDRAEVDTLLRRMGAFRAAA